jgi:hypothetical protein
MQNRKLGMHTHSVWQHLNCFLESPAELAVLLLWVDGLGRLEEGMRRRLYSNEVAGRGPGPRRRGGAGRCSRRAREAGTRGQGTIQSQPIPLHLSR